VPQEEGDFFPPLLLPALARRADIVGFAETSHAVSRRRLVGFNVGDLQKMFKLRIDNGRRVWTLPQDVIDNTVRAFNVSATSPTGYGALGAPQGRYFAPPNGPDCIEITQADLNDQLTGFGDCGILRTETPPFTGWCGRAPRSHTPRRPTVPYLVVRSSGHRCT
jgi:hypothetical protein